MQNNDRAKQFMPFDALKGFKEEINKRKRVIVAKRELSEDDLQDCKDEEKSNAYTDSKNKCG